MKAKIVHASMMIAIGIALISPIIPTSGETKAPPTNGTNPRNAEALPTSFSCRFIAIEKLVVDTEPTQETIRNKENASRARGPSIHTVKHNKNAPIKATYKDNCNILDSTIRDDKWPAACAANIMPIPFKAKNNENWNSVTP